MSYPLHTSNVPTVAWLAAFHSKMVNGKMINGSRYYRALENVSVASALSTALTIYPCHIRVHQHSLTVLNNNFLQLGRRSGGRPQRTVNPRLPVKTVIRTTLAGIEPTTFRLLVRRATSIVLPTHHCHQDIMTFTITGFVADWLDIIDRSNQVALHRNYLEICIAGSPVLIKSYINK